MATRLFTRGPRYERVSGMELAVQERHGGSADPSGGGGGTALVSLVSSERGGACVVCRGTFLAKKTAQDTH